MKALRFDHYGKPEVMEYTDVPTPVIDTDSALVRVRAASVNPSDVKNVSGHFSNTTLPRIPGRDFSGVVEQGPKEWIGAEVWGTGGDIGFTRDGTHAQYIKVPVAALTRKPKTLSHEEAASVGVNFVVAWLGTVDFAQLREGETHRCNRRRWWRGWCGDSNRQIAWMSCHRYRSRCAGSEFTCWTACGCVCNVR